MNYEGIVAWLVILTVVLALAWWVRNRNPRCESRYLGTYYTGRDQLRSHLTIARCEGPLDHQHRHYADIDGWAYAWTDAEALESLSR